MSTVGNLLLFLSVPQRSDAVHDLLAVAASGAARRLRWRDRAVIVQRYGIRSGKAGAARFAAVDGGNAVAVARRPLYGRGRVVRIGAGAGV